MTQCTHPSCEREFATVSAMKIHHTKMHTDAASGVTVSCAHCGADKTIAKSHAERHERHFCNSKCLGAYNSAHRVGENHPAYSRVPKTCEQCGDTFHVKRSSTNPDRFCGRQCMAEWLAETRYGENHHQYVTPVILTCHTCKADVPRKPWQLSFGERAFCSDGCESLWRCTLTGERAPAWDGGLNDYGPGWTAELREEIRERDGNRCQDCGCTQQEHVAQEGQKLHVHHIIKPQHFTDIQDAHAGGNLVTLCRSCHLGKWQSVPGLRPDTRHIA